MPQTGAADGDTYPGDMEACLLSQPVDLVYRFVGGRYFVTHPGRHQIVVLNKAGFTVLELCHQRTVASLRSILEANHDSSGADVFAVDTDTLHSFVRSMEEYGLVTVTAAPA